MENEGPWGKVRSQEGKKRSPRCSPNGRSRRQAKAVGIGANTLLRWLKLPDFQAAYHQARREAFGQPIARFQPGTSAAATTLLKVMIDQGTLQSAKVRAAEAVLNHASKAIEIEDIEARLAELERAAEESKGNR